MTPKEKAAELFFKKFGCKKGYALSTVDELISYLKTSEDVMVSVKAIDYWQEVKQEIEKL